MTKEFFINQYPRFEGPIIQMLALFPEDKLDWSPAENTLTTRAVVQHLSDAVPEMAASLVSGQWTPKPADAEGGEGKSRDELAAGVREAFSEARATLEGLSQEQFETSHSKIDAGVIHLEGTIEELGVSLCLLHSANHVMRLFCYLRQAGVDADSGTLYFGMPPGQFSTRPADMKAGA
jgi:hypothetical protein